MAEKKVMLVCAAGMSTSLLVSKMQKAAKEQGEDVDIFATAASDADNKLESEQPDILMQMLIFLPRPLPTPITN